MVDRQAADKAAKEKFDALWRDGDYWQLESSAYESARYAHLLALVADRRYARILEIGCGRGVFSRQLTRVADRVVALDVSALAIERAWDGGSAGGAIDFRAVNVMEYDPRPDGPFDLIVMTETIYCLGWLYPLFDVGWLAALLFDATSDSGRFLLSNTYGGPGDYLLRPWLIDTYRDLFRHIGYLPEAERPFVGEKDGVTMEVTACLYCKPSGSARVAV